jgi:hypothetical protein
VSCWDVWVWLCHSRKWLWHLSYSACGNHTLRVEITPYVNKSHSCVLKSHFAFRNYNRACVHNRPWSAQSCSTAVRRECWPKGRRTNCSHSRERFSERYAARKSKMVSTGGGTNTNSIKSLTAECPKCHEDKQIVLRWSHDQKTWRLTTKSSIQSQTHWKEKSRKTQIQVGGWGEQR